MSHEPVRGLHWKRRQILGIGAGLLGWAHLPGMRRLRAGEDPPAGAAAPTAAQFIAGKDPRLLVHNAKSPEIETPLELLRAHRVTPKELLFVRNNQTLPGALTLAPAAVEDWRVELTGLVEFPRAITIAQLRELPQVEREVVLQCSGNGRAFVSRTAPAQGAPWSRGAMGNVKFRGPLLKQVIESLQPHVDRTARFLTAEGRDAATGEAADFEHIVPLGDALERAVLALEMNGEPIPAVHGGPVRLVVPGYYGTMFVKWLGRLRFEAEETSNHHQVRRYRTPREPIPPGSEFEYGRENSDPNWRMRIKSVIFAPLDGQALPAGPIEADGVAFNDGAAAIDAVLVSTDGGRHWHSAEVEAPDGPYGWYRWQAKLELPRGKHEIIARAVDALGRSQPLDGAVQWNPAGYGFSAADRVQIEVS